MSYFRGQLAGQLRAAQASTQPGAMLSINLPEDKVDSYLASVAETAVGDAHAVLNQVSVACVNSPLNCTLSGPEAAIDVVKAQADSDKIFAAKLKTGVAYHSRAMIAIAASYEKLMGGLVATNNERNHDPRAKSTTTPVMVSSVTGQPVHNRAVLADAKYWVENMVSQVRFADAVRVMTQQSFSLEHGFSAVTDLVEIGPHAALKRPVQDTIGSSSTIRYASALYRGRSAAETTLELMGLLHCLGHDVSLAAVINSGSGRSSIKENNDNNQLTKKHGDGMHHSPPRPFLVDCPAYPFDHSQRYWAESRISKDFRLREAVTGETLGMRATDWNPLAPRWRAFLCTETMPWIGHHVVSNMVLYPAAGMLLMAIEAVQQQVKSAGREVVGYLVKEARFASAIAVREAWEDRVEVQTLLRPALLQQHEKEASWFDVSVMSYSRDDGGRWTECCTSRVHVQYADEARVDGGREGRLADEAVREQYARAERACSRPVDSGVFYQDAAKAGLEYGQWFRVLRDVAWDSNATAVACADLAGTKYRTASLVHQAVLDAAFHVLRAAAGQHPVTNVPVRLADAWFAASGWQHPQTSTIRWMGTSHGKKVGTGERGSIYALADDGSILCAIREAETAAVSAVDDDTNGEEGSGEKGKNERNLLYNIEWKPQLSLLGRHDLALTCRADTFLQDEGPVIVARQKLCSALELVTARALAGLDKATVPSMRENLRRHVDWMHHYVGGMSAAQREAAAAITDADLEARLREIETLLPTWKLYTVVARNLPAILTNEVDPLQVIFETDLAAVFYADLFEISCADGRLTTFLDLAAHENPALRILEVGAGTGGVTGHVMCALRDREERTGAPSFAEYTYTDVSPMFLEGAKKRWAELQGRMSFATLDLEKDIAGQGSLEPGSYDLVVAGCVLHATVDLEATLRNVRKALRPGGRLLLLEVIKPQDIATNFWTGLVPGWWVAHEEWRPYSAAVPEDQWDTSLKATGFSGNDLVIRDYQSDECHFLSIIVSTAVVGEDVGVGRACAKTNSSPQSLQTTNLVLIVDEAASEQQRELANTVLHCLHSEQRGGQARICTFSLNELAQVDLATDNTVVISLAEADRSLLTNLSSDGFRCLQHLTKHAPKMLWVTAESSTLTSSNGVESQHQGYPHYGAAQGFLRTIRCEQPDLHVVTLAIEPQASNASSAQHIATVFAAAFESSSREVEYLVRQGKILTGRAVQDPAANSTLRSLLVPQVQRRKWSDAPAALRLEVGVPGTLDSLRLVEDSSHGTELGGREVEIEAKAWGLNFRDVLMALGREEGHGLGADCTGVVTRVGAECESSLRPGDRVCMVAEGCMRQYPRAHEGRVCKIPEGMSFDTAASVLVPGLTAYHCLVDIARLQRGEWILVHSAAGSTGQMAVRIAQMLGARVLATTSSSEKKQFIMDTFGISEDHIFHSRTNSFARGVMRVTGGRGVDCVLNSLSGDGLRASWECMAPFGRFVDISVADINADAALPMAMFSKNVTFRALNLMWLSPDATAELLDKTMGLLSDGAIQPPQPLHVFGLTDVEKGFRFLQSGKNVGRIVIMPRPDDVVPVCVAHIVVPSWTSPFLTSSWSCEYCERRLG